MEGDGNRNALHALPLSPLHPFPSFRGNCDLNGGDGFFNVHPICLSRFVGQEWGGGDFFYRIWPCFNSYQRDSVYRGGGEPDRMENRMEPTTARPRLLPRSYPIKPSRL